MNLSNTNLKNFTHPPASIRQRNAHVIMTDYLLTNKNYLQTVFLMSCITNTCMYFDRVYYGSEEMKKALFAFSSSKKGVDYFKMINNAWAVVRKELEPKAIIPLREGKLLNGDQEYFLDEDGEPIPGKVKIID